MKTVVSILIITQSLYAVDSLNKWGIWGSSDSISLNKDTYTIQEALELLEPRATMTNLINNIPQDSLYSKSTMKKYKKHLLKYSKQN